MHHRKITRMASVIAALAVGVAVAAIAHAQQNGQPALTAQDYAEIQRLYARYHWAVDTRNGEAYGQLFTVDGELHAGTGKTVGRASLAELPLKLAGPLTANSALLFSTNIVIEPAPEGARGRAYSVRITPTEPRKPADVTFSSAFEDVFVKTADGWRFKQRKIHSGGLPPL